MRGLMLGRSSGLPGPRSEFLVSPHKAAAEIRTDLAAEGMPDQ